MKWTKHSKTVVRWQHHGGYQEASGRECTITLEPRPHYCDRGNFIAKLHPVGELARSIDGCDLWPRYYFDEERAKLEIEAWLQKRGQLLPPNAEVSDGGTRDSRIETAALQWLLKEMETMSKLKESDNRKLLWLAMNTKPWKSLDVIGIESDIFAEIENRLYPEYDGETVTFEDWGWKTPDGEIRYLPVPGEAVARNMDSQISTTVGADCDGAVHSKDLLGELCCCGAPATGRLSGGGEPRCCATCCFHPLGCRCKYGDPKDTVNEGSFAFEETFK